MLCHIFPINNPPYFLFTSYHYHIVYTTIFEIQFAFFISHRLISFDLFRIKHNKFFIRHNVSQNKALIISKFPSSLPRQAISHTKRPIPHLRIRILCKPRQLPRPTPQISFHLLPIWCCQVRTNNFLYFFNISLFLL